MSTTAAVARSLLPDAFGAGEAAAQDARNQLGGAAPDLVLMFGTAGYDQSRLLEGVRSVFPHAALGGCSGEGVIAQSCSDEREKAVAVMAVCSDAFRFDTHLVREFAEAPAAGGRELARRIHEQGTDDLVSVLVFPDGLTGNCTQFLEALDDALNVPVAVAGGTAGDAMVFERTYQYWNAEVASGSVAAVAVRGRGVMEVAVSHGCVPVGLERTVTRAENGWVFEIDKQPAWSVFKEYLVGDPEDLNAEGIVHLCIGQPLTGPAAADYDPFVIRTPLRLDNDTGALFFPGGGLESGQRIILTRRDQATIRESAEACARTILERQSGMRPSLVLQFDCAGRGKVLFGSCAADEIVKPLQTTLGDTTPWIGFHTYGEIAPIAGHPYYHNYTVAVCAFFDLSGQA